ncbi:hypothetical protein C5L25_002126 [Secundilactobacillus silagei JCM 19001]|uniref:Uncharacterized protein n=1 Tax=Secundilactobacillus silagei JCM 19001 TaxID=1302250 RepID=A0A1Z5IIX2_9LACO|nr:hypothetical protein C5L25_002126 [Secundilactobacillus silagei JCM 19001]GAX01639.1 hypothetical protein IWT126_01682 [Secundilactobacillus silagei JCM 19001]
MTDKKLSYEGTATCLFYKWFYNLNPGKSDRPLYGYYHENGLKYRHIASMIIDI